MRSRSYVLGLLVAGAGLGVAELVNGLYDSARSPVVAVSEAFIEIAPTWLVDWAKSVFGTNDKLVLVIGALIVITLVGLGVGRLAVAGHHAAAAGITTAMSVVGALAVVSRPNAGVSALGPTVAGLAASLGVLAWHRVGIPTAGRRYGTTDPVAMPPELQPTRRRFLYGSAAIGALAVGAAGAGRALGRRFGVGSERKELTLPPAADAAEALGEVDVGVEGVTPFVISNDSFYRIDTAIVSPQVRASDWSLRIHGMVDKELTLTFDELIARPQVERYMTLSCV
ncbi:MAG: molybdopterin-dependent oxidoreductase, partial [Actinomycetota bacterium]|nr:molybdopterin-dependent oxidoreductase [Actinomycetota bacterium]